MTETKQGGNIDEFNSLVKKTFKDCEDILLKKGKDYAGNFDRYANFKKNAERVGLTKYQIWAVYFNKHVDSVLNAIKEDPNSPKSYSEPLSERVKDIINYALLFYGMIEEDNKQNQQNENGKQEFLQP
jgi:hypothetical protein